MKYFYRSRKNSFACPIGLAGNNSNFYAYVFDNDSQEIKYKIPCSRTNSFVSSKEKLIMIFMEI